MYIKAALLFLLLTVSLGFSSFAAVHLPADAPRSSIPQLSVQDFLETPVYQMKDLLGEAPNWKQRWALRMMKGKLKKAVKKNPGLAAHNLQFPSKFSPEQSGPADGKETDTLSLASFVLGIASIPLLFTVIGSFVAALLAIIFGIAGSVNIRRKKDRLKGKGFAIAGIVFGGLVLLFFGIFLLSFGA